MCAAIVSHVVQNLHAEAQDALGKDKQKKLLF